MALVAGRLLRPAARHVRVREPRWLVLAVPPVRREQRRGPVRHASHAPADYPLPRVRHHSVGAGDPVRLPRSVCVQHPDAFRQLHRWEAPSLGGLAFGIGRLRGAPERVPLTPRLPPLPAHRAVRGGGQASSPCAAAAVHPRAAGAREVRVGAASAPPWPLCALPEAPDGTGHRVRVRCRSGAHAAVALRPVRPHALLPALREGHREAPRGQRALPPP